MGIRQWATRQASEYSNGEERPLGGYLAALSGYGVLVGALAAVGKVTGSRVPDRVGPGDVAMLAVSANYLARTVAKDPITSPLRAPFTRFDGVSGPATLSEQVRGTGPRHAVGELISCPLCLAQWMATLLAGAMVVAPRGTRFVMVVLSAVWGADVLQFARTLLEGEAENS